MDSNQEVPLTKRNRLGVSITDENRGGAVNLAAWICLVIMCLFVLLKVASKLFRTHSSFKIRNLNPDDYLILAAMVFAIFQSVAVTKQVDAGLGQHRETFTPAQVKLYEKAGYASQFLYVLAVTLSKTAVMFFIMTLSRSPWHRVVIGAMSFISIWLVTSLFAIAFQCRLPTPWAIISDACFDQGAFWIFFGMIDVILTVVLIGFPIYVLWNLQVSWTKKSAVIVAFAIRIIEVPIIISRIVYISRTSVLIDRTSVEWTAAVVTTVAMNVSIILSCVPYLKPFINNLQSGWSSSNVRTGLGYSSIVSKDVQSYAIGSVVKKSTPHSSGATVPSSNDSFPLRQYPENPANEILRIIDYTVQLEPVYQRDGKRDTHIGF